MEKSKLESLLNNFQRTHRELLEKLETFPEQMQELSNQEFHLRGRLKANENDIKDIEKLLEEAK